MEKVYDIHIHYNFDIPMPEMVEIFKEEFNETGTEKFCFLSLPHHASGEKLFTNENQNIKGLFLKHAFSPNAYAFAGLIHPQNQMSDEERAKNYFNQAVEYNKAGFDGIKMLEGHPTLRRAMGRALNDNVYDKFYSYLEQNKTPIIMHVADPEGSWAMETASEDAKALGRTYCDDFPSKQQLTNEVFALLEKHPKLKLGLAHFGFMSYDINEAERFLNFENTFFDLTPGGEQLIKMAETWDEWLSFFNKYQDRIVYGSDFYAFPKKDEQGWRTAFRRRPDFLRHFFETDAQHNYLDATFNGVKIEKSLRDKLYRDNFEKMLGTPKIINKEYFKNYIEKLLRNLPCGDTYFTKDGIIDISKSENLKKVIDCYVGDLNYMLKIFLTGD